MGSPLPGATSYKSCLFQKKGKDIIHTYTHTHTHTHMMEYYSDIKTEIMSLAATWMDLEMHTK